MKEGYVFTVAGFGQNVLWDTTCSSFNSPF